MIEDHSTKNIKAVREIIRSDEPLTEEQERFAFAFAADVCAAIRRLLHEYGPREEQHGLMFNVPFSVEVRELKK